jgi:hypothetical protein
MYGPQGRVSLKHVRERVREEEQMEESIAPAARGKGVWCSASTPGASCVEIWLGVLRSR